MTKVITKAITPEFTNSEIPQSFFQGEQDIYILNEAAYLQIERVKICWQQWRPTHAVATSAKSSYSILCLLLLSFSKNPFLGTVFNLLANLYARITNLKKGL